MRAVVPQGGTVAAPAELYLQSRGWSAQVWTAAADRLTSRGLLDGPERPTVDGRALRDGIERRTDELALAPFGSSSSESVERLLTALDPAVASIAQAGEIAFPNPMGLPRPRRAPGG